MPPTFAEDFEQDVRETVDHPRQGVEAGRGIDHPEHLAPDHAIEVEPRRFETRQHRKRNQARGLVGLVGTDFRANLAERSGDGAVRSQGQVPRDGGPVAGDMDKLEALPRDVHRGRQLVP